MSVNYIIFYFLLCLNDKFIAFCDFIMLLNLPFFFQRGEVPGVI